MIHSSLHRNSSDLTVQLLETELLPSHSSPNDPTPNVGFLVIETSQGYQCASPSLLSLIIRYQHQSKFSLDSRTILFLVHCHFSPHRLPSPSHHLPRPDPIRLFRFSHFLSRSQFHERNVLQQ